MLSLLTIRFFPTLYLAVLITCSFWFLSLKFCWRFRLIQSFDMFSELWSLNNCSACLYWHIWDGVPLLLNLCRVSKDVPFDGSWLSYLTTNQISNISWFFNWIPPHTGDGMRCSYVKNDVIKWCLSPLFKVVCFVRRSPRQVRLLLWHLVNIRHLTVQCWPSLLWGQC